jgi:hypothetical protein
MCNFIDSKEYVSVPLKQDTKWFHRHSLCFSADPLSSLFLGVVKILETSEDLTIQLWSWKTNSKKSPF